MEKYYTNSGTDTLLGLASVQLAVEQDSAKK